MPEGPEVQVVVDNLQFLKGGRVKSLYKYNNRPWIVPANLPFILNKRIDSVDRLGKFIVLDLEGKHKLVCHLSFTGSFRFNSDEYSVLKLRMDNGKDLIFSDKRGLGKIRLMTNKEFEQDPTLSSHKVDGLRDSVETIYQCLRFNRDRGIRKEIKPFLLDFHYICGIGNIYGSEICFHARINPLSPLNTLSDEELDRLSKSVSFILQRAYAAGGSSIESFMDIGGNKGHAQDYHRVYHIEVCEDCGSKIEMVTQAERSTFYCPKCQGVNV